MYYEIDTALWVNTDKIISAILSGVDVVWTYATGPIDNYTVTFAGVPEAQQALDDYIIFVNTPPYERLKFIRDILPGILNGTLANAAQRKAANRRGALAFKLTPVPFSSELEIADKAYEIAEAMADKYEAENP